MNDQRTSGREGGGWLSRLLWGSRPAEGPGAGAPEPGCPSETIDAETVEEVWALLEKRRKIDAIQLYREAARCGLKDAKMAVDRMARQRAA